MLSSTHRWMPEVPLNALAPYLMEGRPNTYTYTKAMAEIVISQEKGNLPVAIVRPSIVAPSIRDPVPGWIDTVNGPAGLGLLASLGILRTIDWDPSVRVDL